MGGMKEEREKNEEGDARKWCDGVENGMRRTEDGRRHERRRRCVGTSSSHGQTK